MTKKRKQPEHFARYGLDWEPISNLPELVRTIDKTLKDALEQEPTMTEARTVPHVFGDDLIYQARELIKMQADITEAALANIDRWKTEPLTLDQHFDLVHVNQQCQRLKTVLSSMLASLDFVRSTTSHGCQSWKGVRKMELVTQESR